MKNIVLCAIYLYLWQVRIDFDKFVNSPQNRVGVCEEQYLTIQVENHPTSYILIKRVLGSH